MTDLERNALAGGKANENSIENDLQKHYNTSGQKITYTIWLNKSGTKKADKCESWPEFCQWLQDLPPAIVKDDCKLIKLARFGDMRTPLRDNGDGTKSGNSLRHNDNVLEVTGIEGDYDNGEMTPEQAVELLERHKLKAIIAPIFSATPDAPQRAG